MKYFWYGENIPFSKMSDRVVTLNTRIRKYEDKNFKQLYLLIIKNEEVMNIETIISILKLKNIYFKTQAPNTEIRIYSIYDLIEGKTNFIRLEE